MRCKTLALTALTLILIAPPLLARATTVRKTNRIEWGIQQQWNIPAEPVSMVQALDNSKVFILGTDSKVYIFNPDGALLGSIPVDPDTTAIDIAPRGESLYLVNKKQHTYTALSISITQDIDITGAPFIGPENAPITMVVFSDFQ